MPGECEIKVRKYLRNARPWFDGLEIEETGNIDIDGVSKHFYEMATAYYMDAVHFYKKKEYTNSLAALEYAEGWLDAGCALGIFRKHRV